MTRSGAPGRSSRRARIGVGVVAQVHRPAATSAPAASTSAQSITWLESTIWPCSSVRPGRRRARRRSTPRRPAGVGAPSSSATLAAAASARCPGPSRVPAGSTTSPARTSSPRCRSERPASGARCSATSVAPPSVSSTGHDGVGALGHRGAGHDPQHLARLASTCRVVSPAAMSPATGSTTGVCRRWRRRARPRARRTRPSPSCRSRAGRPGADDVARPGRARAPSPTGTLVAGSGATRASTVARCSASVRIRRRPRGGRRRGCCARRR